MDVAELLLLWQLQQANAAWQIGRTADSGPAAASAAASQDGALFAALLQTALQESGHTGQAVAEAGHRGMAAAGGPAAESAYSGLIEAAGRKYNVDPALIRQVIMAESGFDSQAVSSAGAQGLMQLMPGIAASYGVTDSFDPAQNIDAGTHLLRDLLNRFQGDARLALAAYNAGPGAVEKYRGIPPYEETQAYVRRILTQLGKVDHEV